MERRRGDLWLITVLPVPIVWWNTRYVIDPSSGPSWEMQPQHSYILLHLLVYIHYHPLTLPSLTTRSITLSWECKLPFPSTSDNMIISYSVIPSQQTLGNWDVTQITFTNINYINYYLQITSFSPKHPSLPVVYRGSMSCCTRRQYGRQP